MAENYVLLETIELTQSAATVLFDNIPQTGYTDLIIKVSARTVRNTEEDGLYMVLNSLNSNGFRDVESNGTSVSSVATASYGNNWVTRVNGGTSTSGSFGNADIYIADYTGNRHKAISIDGVTENNAALSYTNFTTSLWPYTASVTSISFGCNANFAVGSSFSLYGIAALNTNPTIAPKATGGNIVANDGTYWYHAFLNSGTFSPQTSLTCDLMVVAGGGGGGSRRGGGGGAGGLLAFTSQALSAQDYLCIVGAGGMGAPGTLGGGAAGNNGTKGADSQFGSLTASVGGGGATGDGEGATSAMNGGSGGGSTGAYAGGTGTSGQGNNGGFGSGLANNYGAGGGGGKGSAGANGTGSTGGNGGAGTNAYSAWASATSTGASGYYAGGGGGAVYDGGTAGTGGAGGGGNAGAGGGNNSGFAGSANTGGGGGGSSILSSGTAAAGNGASGIIIIRYAM